MMIEVYIDGSSKGNPGPGGAGIVIQDKATQETLGIHGIPLGYVTNNQAEFLALKHALIVTKLPVDLFNNRSRCSHQVFCKLVSTENALLSLSVVIRITWPLYCSSIMHIDYHASPIWFCLKVDNQRKKKLGAERKPTVTSIRTPTAHFSLPYSLANRSISSFTFMSCVSWNFRASASIFSCISWSLTQGQVDLSTSGLGRFSYASDCRGDH